MFFIVKKLFPRGAFLFAKSYPQFFLVVYYCIFTRLHYNESMTNQDMRYIEYLCCIWCGADKAKKKAKYCSTNCQMKAQGKQKRK